MSRMCIVSALAIVACSMTFVAPCALGAPAQASWADARADLDLSIKVSPQGINLDGRADGDWVTVHTDIPYAYVDAGTVALNGIAAAMTYADDRGNLVAKFSMTAVREIVAPPATELTLTGMTDDGVAFSGSDVIMVLDR